MHHCWLFPSPLAPLAAALLAGTVAGQQVRPVPPAGGAIAPPAQEIDDEGIPVELFENLNLDRYLRRAQDFLGREDYAAAIQVLQDVVDGRTVEVVGAAPEPAAPGAAPSAGQERPAGGSAPMRLDARQSVFSEDGRLYRPIRRLCHELLARLPAVGLELYRATYEVAAAEMLERAMGEGTAGALEMVANRYFVTLPAGRALALLGDRLMHEGRHRAAAQVWRDLVELYPPEHRRRLGISDVWCGFKIALCLRLAGERDAARDAAIRLAAAHPAETLRILGELQAVKELPTSELFAGAIAEARTDLGGAAAVGWLRGSTEALVPLWQYRFRCPDPYRDAKAGNDQGRLAMFDETQRATLMPHAARYGGGTWVSLTTGPGDLPQVAFLEHFRLRLADAASGVMIAATDQPDEPPPPRENHPRVRIAAVDFALLRPVDDGARRYVVVGHRGKTTVSTEALKSSELQAYDRTTMRLVWSSAQWADGEAGFADVTFLAAPTVFGERLLLPALRRGAYSLECLERTTGRPIWHTPLHAGGSQFWKAPGTPVAVSGGTAFVVTNAGCLAAVDAFGGDLRWLRRYERTDPIRPVRRSRAKMQAPELQFGQQFQQGELKGFLPNELIVTDGLVVCAPCDSDLLMCVDGATGKPVWIVDGATRYAPYGQLRTIVGAARGNLFATADRHLVCIGLEGGLVKWSRELPLLASGKHGGRGRGAIAGAWVLVPSEREVLVFDVDGREPMRRIALPAFDPSRDPLGGAATVMSHGPWLVVGYPGGVEVFSTREALTELAAATADPLRKAVCLVQAGAPADAEAVLVAGLRAPADAGSSRAMAEQLLLLATDRAAAISRGGDLAGGLAVLDGIVDLLGERAVRMQWHLARLELCKSAQDLRAHEREQQRLYDFMEGRG